MIYTITFNPALDYISQVDNFEVGKINRTKTEEILSGGKGLNVSTVLSNLGIESTALGFIAGFTGEELKKNIEEKGIKTDFINVKKGITRINVKISSKEETALNGNGPEITEENIKELIEKIDKIKSEDKETKVVEKKTKKKINIMPYAIAGILAISMVAYNISNKNKIESLNAQLNKKDEKTEVILWIAAGMILVISAAGLIYRKHSK